VIALLSLQEAYIRAGFGEREYHNTTNLNAVGALVLTGVVLAAVSLKRRHALLPLLLLSSAVPTGQRVAILTLDFNLIRLALLAYAARVLVRGEYRGFRTRRCDQLVLAWLSTRMVAYVALHASTGAFIFQAGQLYDFLGLYFVARLYLRTQADVLRAWRWFAMLSLPVAALFLVEQSSGRNLFSALGGVPEFTNIREGRLRCQGPYEHPILAGAYWAMLVPGFLGMARSTSRAIKRAGRVGLGCALIVIIACSSSTPLIGVAAGLGLAACFTARRHAREALLAFGGLLVLVHFARERPVWQLIAEVGVVGGSTATYRYRLIDAFIRNWSEWFLIGTKGTAHWGRFLYDLTNQYVVEGVRGGILTLILFVWTLSSSLRRSWSMSLSRGVQRAQRLVTWHTAAALGGAAVMFLGISITHSNQTVLVLMFLIAATQAGRAGAGRPKTAAPRAGASDAAPQA